MGHVRTRSKSPNNAPNVNAAADQFLHHSWSTAVPPSHRKKHNRMETFTWNSSQLVIRRISIYRTVCIAIYVESRPCGSVALKRRQNINVELQPKRLTWLRKTGGRNLMFGEVNLPLGGELSNGSFIIFCRCACPIIGHFMFILDYNSMFYAHRFGQVSFCIQCRYVKHWLLVLRGFVMHVFTVQQGWYVIDNCRNFERLTNYYLILWLATSGQPASLAPKTTRDNKSMRFL